MAEPILARDEYMHEPTDDPQFNESAYYNFVDGDSGFAVLIRMGNRVNEGHAEVTVLVYLPDGGACIRFDRAFAQGDGHRTRDFIAVEQAPFAGRFHHCQLAQLHAFERGKPRIAGRAEPAATN